jgi:hypothetical protein
MTLIRGVQSKHPCPICLVPKEDQGNLFERYPVRSSEESMALVRQCKLMSKGDAEDLLSKQSLRPVEVGGILNVICCLIQFHLYRMHFGMLHSLGPMRLLDLMTCMLMMVVLVENTCGH